MTQGIFLLKNPNFTSFVVVGLSAHDQGPFPPELLSSCVPAAPSSKRAVV